MDMCENKGNTETIWSIDILVKIFVMAMAMLLMICFPLMVEAAAKKPGMPKLTSANAQATNAVTISWKKVSGATSYRVSYREKGSKTWIRISTGLKGTSYTHISSKKFPLKQGKTYQYTVRSLNGNIAGGYNKKGIIVSIPVSAGKNLSNSWVNLNGERYYRKNGGFVSGWKKIKGKYYYFDPLSRKMLKNTIAGTAKKGYHYVDRSGIRVTDRVIEEAVTFVLEHTDKNQTPKQKLQACYNYIVKQCQYRAASDKESIKKMPSYALFMFRTHTGNCYRGAVALAYCAKVLGFESRMGIGGVTAYSDRDLATHGWTEIKVNGKWYVCDTSMQRYHPYTNLFLLPMKKYPYRIRIDKHYSLNITNGVVKWIA